MTGEQIAWIVENYPTTRNSEIIKRTGITRHRLSVIRKEYCLRKSAAFIAYISRKNMESLRIAMKESGNYYGFRQGFSNSHRFGLETEHRRIENMRQARHKLVESERRRLLFGLKTKTRLGVSLMDKKERMRCQQIRHGLRKQGYMVIEKNAYYDGNTTRSARRELFASKHGFTFTNKDNPSKDNKVIVLPDWEQTTMTNYNMTF